MELLWVSKNGASEAGALAVAPGLAQMRSLKKFTCDFKDVVEVHLPQVSQGDKDDWNRRLKALMGINEVNEEKKKRAEAAKVRLSKTDGQFLLLQNKYLSYTNMNDELIAIILAVTPHMLRAGQWSRSCPEDVFDRSAAQRQQPPKIETGYPAIIQRRC